MIRFNHSDEFPMPGVGKNLASKAGSDHCKRADQDTKADHVLLISSLQGKI